MKCPLTVTVRRLWSASGASRLHAVLGGMALNDVIHLAAATLFTDDQRRDAAHTALPDM